MECNDITLHESACDMAEFLAAIRRRAADDQSVEAAVAAFVVGFAMCRCASLDVPHLFKYVHAQFDDIGTSRALVDGLKSRATDLERIHEGRFYRGRVGQGGRLASV
jgi:hypothetical protein